MNEKKIQKLISYKLDKIIKREKSYPSKLTSTNMTQLINGNSNKNNNSNIFTNEALIKNIVNNTTSPFSSYNTNVKSTKLPKKILYLENNPHNRSIKAKLLLLLTNINSIYLKMAKTKLNFNKIKNNYITSDNKKIILKSISDKKYNTQRIKFKKIKLDTNSENDKNIMTELEKQGNKRNKDMKLLKFKLFKILKENSLNICDTFEKRNNSFNIKLKNYLQSDRYIKGKEIESDNLHQNKKGFSSSHDLLKFYYEPQVDKETNEELMAYSIFNNFSDDERNIMSSNPKYFSIDKKKFLLKKLNIVLNDNLKDKILREEKNDNEYNFKQEENKNNNTNLNINIKRIFNRKKAYELKINENKINNKIIEYHQKNLIKQASKNRIIDGINSNVNEYYKKYYSFCHQNFLKCEQNRNKEHFYRMFNYPLSFKMTREYQLNSNKNRIYQKEVLHKLKMQEKIKDDSLHEKINNFKNIIKINYDKVKNG